jgi:hypothetical protein
MGRRHRAFQIEQHVHRDAPRSNRRRRLYGALGVILKGDPFALDIVAAEGLGGNRSMVSSSDPLGPLDGFPPVFGRKWDQQLINEFLPNLGSWQTTFGPGSTASAFPASTTAKPSPSRL